MGQSDIRNYIIKASDIVPNFNAESSFIKDNACICLNSAMYRLNERICSRCYHSDFWSDKGFLICKIHTCRLPFRKSHILNNLTVDTIKSFLKSSNTWEIFLAIQFIYINKLNISLLPLFSNKQWVHVEDHDNCYHLTNAEKLFRVCDVAYLAFKKLEDPEVKISAFQKYNSRKRDQMILEVTANT